MMFTFMEWFSPVFKIWLRLLVKSLVVVFILALVVLWFTWPQFFYFDNTPRCNVGGWKCWSNADRVCFLIFPITVFFVGSWIWAAMEYDKRKNAL